MEAFKSVDEIIKKHPMEVQRSQYFGYIRAIVNSMKHCMNSIKMRCLMEYRKPATGTQKNGLKTNQTTQDSLIILDKAGINMGNIKRNPVVTINNFRLIRESKPVSTTKNSMRNQPCPCGSRKKFKKCCWSKEVY